MNTALAKTLLHFIWEGGLIALALALVLKVVRPVFAQLRYGAACMAMLAMLAAFGATLVRFWPHTEKLPPPVIDFRWSQSPMEAPTPPPAPSTNQLWWLAPAWMLGACLFSLRSFASWLSAQRLRKIGVCAAPEYWQQRMYQLAGRIRVSRPVTLLESCLADVPVVLGCVRPVILLPAGLLTGFPAEQIEYFLIHELAHIRRWDYLTNLLQTAAENLLFYHPAVWWVSSIIRAERENCCDDVVAKLGDAREFAAALAALEQGRGALVQPALAANGGDLMNRVRRLLGHPEPRRSAVGPVLLLVLALAIAVAIAAPQKPAPSTPAMAPPMPAPAAPAPEPRVLLAQAQTTPAPPAASPDDSSIPAPYRNWLNEEVVYIITEAERKAFRSLRADEELQMFIEQFWLRRDPTPGTPENEMREEHYRRIAYVNDHFATVTVPGWKTDRGMIYIKFGPPDEKESHPNDAPPREIWLYRFITGIGTNVYMEFVDSSHTGEYRLTKDPNAAAPVPQAVQPPPAGGGRGPARQAAQGSNGTILAVTPRAAGTVVSVHVTDRQNVTAGQLLVDLDSNNPAYNHVVSPVAGVVTMSGPLQAGQHVEPGQQLLVVRPRIPLPAAAPVPQAPLSYFQAEVRALEYQAGWEASYLRIKYDEDFDGPRQKVLGDAMRELTRLAKDTGLSTSAEAREALESARTLVEGVRTERLREQASKQKSSPVAAGASLPPTPPWWAPDPLDPAAVVRSIELTANVQGDGTARSVAVVRATDIGLNQSAIEAVQSWRFPVTGGVFSETYTVRVLVDPSKLARR